MVKRGDPGEAEGVWRWEGVSRTTVELNEGKRNQELDFWLEQLGGWWCHCCSGESSSQNLYICAYLHVLLQF